MTTTGVISFSLALIAVAYFVWVGLRTRQASSSDADFLGAGRSQGSARISHTWFASTVAFGTAAFYYMQIVPIWGWIVLLASVGTYAAGQLLVIYQSKKLFSATTGTESITDLLRVKSGSVFAPAFIGIMNYIQGVSIVFLELFLGVAIFKFIFPFSSGYVDAFVLCAICTAVFFYIAIGGFKAVIISDSIQFYLILAGIFALIASVIPFAINNLHTTGQVMDLAPTAPLASIVPYVMFAALINLSSSLGQVASWQKILAADSIQSARAGGVRGVVMTSLAFATFVVVAGIYNASDAPVASAPELFENVSAFSGLAGEYLLAPVVFVAVVAAIISTIDSATIASVLSVKGNRDLRAPDVDDARLNALLVASVLVIAVAIFLYVSFVGISYINAVVTIAFFAYSVTAFFAPTIVVLLRSPERLRSPRMLSAGLVIGFACVSAGAIAENQLGNGDYRFQITGTLVAMITSTALTSRLWVQK